MDSNISWELSLSSNPILITSNFSNAKIILFSLIKFWLSFFIKDKNNLKFFIILDLENLSKTFSKSVSYFKELKISFNTSSSLSSNFNFLKWEFKFDSLLIM